MKFKQSDKCVDPKGEKLTSATLIGRSDDFANCGKIVKFRARLLFITTWLSLMVMVSSSSLLNVSIYLFSFLTSF